MNREFWNHQNWVWEQKYPKGYKSYFVILMIWLVFLISIIFCYHYSVDHIFYGVVKDVNQNTIEMIVPVDELEQFQSIVKENRTIELKQVQPNIELIAGKHVMLVDVIVPISEKLLVENNVIPIRLKEKKVTLFEELYQKWKRGMKNEKNGNETIRKSLWRGD